MNPSSPIEQQGSSGSERPAHFVPTPERVSQYLDLKTEEVEAQMKSVEGRTALFTQLMAEREALHRDHDAFDPEVVRLQMEAAGEALAANERYLQDIRSPEKQGLMRRVWATVKGFPRKHPIVTLLLASAAVGGVAGYLGYLPPIDFEAWWMKLKDLLKFGGGGGALEAVGTATETMAEAAASGAVDVRTVGGMIEFAGKTYQPEAFAEVIKTLRAANPDLLVTILPDASSKASVELLLKEALRAEGLAYEFKGGIPGLSESWFPPK